MRISVKAALGFLALSAMVLISARSSISQQPPTPPGPPTGQQQQMTIQDRINMMMDMLSRRAEFTDEERGKIKELLDLKGKYEEELQKKRRDLARLAFRGEGEEEVEKAFKEYVELYEKAIKEIGDKEKELIKGLSLRKKTILAAMRVIYSTSMFPQMPAMQRTGGAGGGAPQRGQ
jgi:hypothetical protein